MVPEDEALIVIDAMLWAAAEAPAHGKTLFCSDRSRGANFAKGAYEKGTQANANMAFRAARTYFEIAFQADPCLKYLIAMANMDLKIGEYHLAIEVYRRVCDGPSFRGNLLSNVPAATATEIAMCHRKLEEAATALDAYRDSTMDTAATSDRDLRHAISWRGPFGGGHVLNLKKHGSSPTTPTRKKHVAPDLVEKAFSVQRSYILAEEAKQQDEETAEVKPDEHLSRAAVVESVATQPRDEEAAAVLRETHEPVAASQAETAYHQ